MKKLLWGLPILLLLGAGCASGGVNPVPTSTEKQPEETSQVYTNGTYGFEFSYPKEYVFVTPTYPFLQDKIVQLQTPRGSYPNTNFADADFSVSASYVKNPATCFQNEQGRAFTSTSTINGVDYRVSTSTDAAAGNLYSSKIYRAVVGNQTCIELNETIHTGNIGNYPTGTVTEVDQGPIWDQLEKITQSFKFNG